MSNKSIDFRPTIKQYQALEYLLDNNTTHILYGGAVGGGKSFLGCMWIFLNAISKPDTRYLIGRSRLNVLKNTTLKTLKDILKDYDNLIDYHINMITNTITFKNGSEIILMDLFPYPSDPDYDRLGSLEITAAFIDELSEISYKGFEVLFTRIRYKLNEYKLTPKLFCASNPTQGWPKRFFYKPYKEGTLKDNIKFIPALPNDNPYIPETYIENLNKSLTPQLKSRLLKGEWDFDDDDYNIFNYEDIQQAFYNEVPEGETYISCDVANIGTDNTIIIIWKGLKMLKTYKYSKYDTQRIIKILKEKMNIYKCKIQNVIIDADGLGVGVSDGLKGCVAFKGSSAAVNKLYKNMRNECYFKLAELIQDVKFDMLYQDDITQELINTRIDDKKEIQLISKDQIKRNIGRSPDIADAIMMRMYYFIKKERQKTYVY